MIDPEREYQGTLDRHMDSHLVDVDRVRVSTRGADLSDFAVAKQKDGRFALIHRPGGMVFFGDAKSHKAAEWAALVVADMLEAARPGLTTAELVARLQRRVKDYPAGEGPAKVLVQAQAAVEREEDPDASGSKHVKAVWDELSKIMAPRGPQFWLGPRRKRGRKRRNNPPAAPELVERVEDLDEFADAEGFDAAWKHNATWHDNEPTHAELYRIDDGLPDDHVRVVSGLGRIPETHYFVEDPDSNKHGPHWQHHHHPGYEPIEYFDPATGMVGKVLNGAIVTDWYREKHGEVVPPERPARRGRKKRRGRSRR